MTIKEYVSQRLQAFGLNEAILTDIMFALNMDLEAQYTPDIAHPVGKALALALEELILAPRLSNVSESGFSMSWDFSGIGKYYVYLCNKYGLTVNDDILVFVGVSAIVDRTSSW